MNNNFFKLAVVPIVLFTIFAIPLGIMGIINTEKESYRAPIGEQSVNDDTLSGESLSEEPSNINRERDTYDYDLNVQENYSGSVTNSKEDSDTKEKSRVKEQEATFTIKAKDTKSTFDRIIELASEYDGYVAKSYFTSQRNQTSTITMRVPADKLQPVLESIRNLDIEVISENVSVLDRQNELTESQKTKSVLEQKLETLKNNLNTAKTQAEKNSIQAQIDETNRQIQSAQKSIESIQKETLFSTVYINLSKKTDASGVFEFSSIPSTLKIVLVFWLNVFIILAIPLIVIYTIYKLVKRTKRK